MVDVDTNFQNSKRAILIEQVGAVSKSEHIYFRVHPHLHHPGHI